MKKLFCLLLVLAWSLPLLSMDARVIYRKGKNEVLSERVKLQELENDTFRLRIPKDQLPDPSSADTVDIIINEAIAKKGEPGYWVIGDGRMGYFTRDKGYLSERRNPLPIFGVKKGDTAFVGIVKGFKYDFSATVKVINGVYEVFPRFHFEWIKRLSPRDDIIVDFIKLKGADASYAGMARKYRQYQLERGEVKPLKERVKNNPQLAYTADTMFLRFAMGAKPFDRKNPIEYQTPDIEPPVRVYRTFDKIMEAMKKLKAMGVDKAEVCFVGWNSGGFDGRFPTILPADPAYGGTEKMKEATALGKSLGYQMVCHVCNTDFYYISDRFSFDSIARNFDGTLRRVGNMSGGLSFNPCFKEVFEKYIRQDYDGLRDIGLKGTHHIDVTSCITPYPCFDPAHPCTREDTADYMNKIGELAREYFGGFGSEGPCDHVARSLDYALYVWAYPSWVGARHPLMDRLVPVWQIAYHGIILSNPYYATIDYNYEKIKRPNAPESYHILPDIPTRRLKLYEFGGRPTFYGGIRDNNLKPIKEAYDEYQPMKYLQYEFMDDHRELAPDVFLTVYSDGSEVVTNYTDKPFEYKGKSVNAKDYCLFKLESGVK